MKPTHIILTVLLALGAGYLGSGLGGSAAKQSEETSYERVIRTGTLRCGYAEWDSAVMKDPNTGKFHGSVVDVVDALAKAMDIKVTWALQVNWGDVVAALKSGKIDAMCAGMWTSALKAKHIAFTVPYAYQQMEVFARADDARFDNNLAALNDPAVKLAIIENDGSGYIATEDFPKAQTVPMGAITSTDTDLMLHVATNKADATFTVTGLFRQFEKTNPGKLKIVPTARPLRVFGLSAMVVDNTDLRLQQAIDAAMEELLNSGAVDRILDTYDTRYPGMYMRAARVYELK